MPQFDFAYWPGQIVWLLIVFAVLYGILAKVFLPRLSGGLDTRRSRIEGDMAEARRLRDEAEAQSAAVHQEMAEARARAQRTALEAKARAKAQAAARQAALEAELSAKLTEAEGRIRSARELAMGEVGSIAGDAATAIAEKLGGAPVSPADLDRAREAVAGRAAA